MAHVLGKLGVAGLRHLAAKPLPEEIPQRLLAGDRAVGVPQVDLGAEFGEQFVDRDQHVDQRFAAPQFAHRARHRFAIGRVPPVGAGVIVLAGDAEGAGVHQRLGGAWVARVDRDVMIIARGRGALVHRNRAVVGDHGFMRPAAGRGLSRAPAFALLIVR